LVALFLLYVPGSAVSNTLESLFSPGDLSQAHAEFDQQCSECHNKTDKTRQDALCLSCHDHKDVKKDIEQGTGLHGRLKMPDENACKQCHREHRGRDADIAAFNTGSFDHGKTDFQLKGRHTVLNCQSCHKPEKKYRDASETCFGCHEKEDVHKGELGEECESCHVSSGWNESGFDHDTVEDFPLRGNHEQVDCQLCHVGNHFKDTPRACSSCHSLNDVHGGRYGQKCHTCHNEQEWKKSTFDHFRDAEYRLTGKHKLADCDTCHTGNLYTQKLENTCASCHGNDDIHKGRNGEQCQDCHSTRQWGQTDFDHDIDTEFRLTGKHVAVTCESCHGVSIEKEIRTDCYSCHNKIDPHQGELGKRCDNCHNTQGWRAEVFFEHDITRFPLIGMHAVTACEHCHFSENYRAAPLECLQCHQNQDEHKGRFGEHCETCHNPNSWNTWLFDHNKQTHFELDGAHEEAECYSCHRTELESQSGLARNCAACHSGDDVHQGGFGRYCDRCHNTQDFRQIDMSGSY